MNPGQNDRRMSASDQTSDAVSPGGRLANQPYLLLSFTALCWAGNAIVGRLAAGHIPPVTLSFLRWSIAFFIILPFAWKHLARDWSAIRGHLTTMIVLSVTGIAAFNTLQYWALEHTQALNTLLLQSAGPLFVAVWSLMLLGVRLTLAQAGGIVLSLVGVLVILLHGDLTALTSIQFNKGDLIFTVALAIFGFYSVLSLKRPKIHGLSFRSDPAARRLDRAHQHPVQQGRPHLHRGAGDLRVLFGAVAEAPQDSRPVVRRLHLRLRLGVPGSDLDLGTVDAPGDATGYGEPLEPVLCRGISINAGLSVLQSQRAADRCQPRRTDISCGPGIRIGDGNHFSRRAAAVVPYYRLCAGADRCLHRVAKTRDCALAVLETDRSPTCTTRLQISRSRPPS